MEIKRYVNGKTVSEKELHSMKIMTPEITSAVNEVRRRTAAKPEPAQRANG